MKILMIMTSHDQLGNTGRRLVFGLKSLLHRTLFLETPVSI